MITEWSAFYPTLTNPETSAITDCLAIAPEPKGLLGASRARRLLACGGDPGRRRREGGWLAADPVADLKANAQRFVEEGGVSARQSVYEIPEVREKFTYVPALVGSWKEGVPEFRPRFAEWPTITEIVQDGHRK